MNLSTILAEPVCLMQKDEYHPNDDICEAPATYGVMRKPLSENELWFILSDFWFIAICLS